MLKKVNGGIFIDYDCTGVQPVSEGIFIPTGYQNNLTEDEFKKDLETFLGKWFPEAAEASSQERL